ncbi:MAG: sulfite exporter TauE/SafE family protein [Rhodomicrobium sp.]|nr:sulfite exporter TauE/SafE family protein [Rhodomicrobium sp.]
MPFSDIALAALGLFFAGIVKGATGLGYSSCALPFLAAAFGLKMAIVLVVIPAMVSNLAVMWTAGYLRETLVRFKRFYLSTIPGVCVGLFALTWADQRYSEVSLGVLIVGYSVYSVFKPTLTLPSHLQGPLQIPAGLLNGFFTGLTGSQVLPLLPYMLSLRLDPDRFVQAVNMAVTISAAVMVVGLLSYGLMTTPDLLASILCIAPAMIGIGLGGQVRRLIPSAHFRVVVLIVLALIGLALIVGR